MYVRGGSHLPIQMPAAECNIAVEPEVYAEMSPASQQSACPPPALQRGETFK